MKKYIIDAISRGQKVAVHFGNEHFKTFDLLIDAIDDDDSLIELGKGSYSNSYLVNLNQVEFVRTQKT